MGGGGGLLHLVDLAVEHKLNLLAKGQPLRRIRRLLEELEILGRAKLDFDDGRVRGFLEVGVDPSAVIQEECFAAGEPALVGDEFGRVGAAGGGIESQGDTTGCSIHAPAAKRDSRSGGQGLGGAK